MEHKAHIAVHGDRPAIGNLIIVHENRGLDDHIRDVTNQFAAIGLNTIAPDYLSPVGGSVADAVRRAWCRGALEGVQVKCTPADQVMRPQGSPCHDLESR